VLGSSGRVGFEADRAEVVASGDTHVGVEGGGQAAEQGDGGLGAAFFDAFDLVVVMPARKATSAGVRLRAVRRRASSRVKAP
jgi:hypothetical protein